MSVSLTAHPGYSRALSAVRSGEIGLLRAIALDLVTAGDSTALDLLGPTAIELLRGVTGPASVELQAFITSGGRAVSFLGRTKRAVVVSAHQSVVAGDQGVFLRAAIRIVGTHGSVLVDLLKPALDVRTTQGFRNIAFIFPREDQPGAPGAVEALGAIARSARSGQPESVTW